MRPLLKKEIKQITFKERAEIMNTWSDYADIAMVLSIVVIITFTALTILFLLR